MDFQNFFGFLGEIFWISRWKFLDFSVKMFVFLNNLFWISWWNLLDFLVKVLHFSVNFCLYFSVNVCSFFNFLFLEFLREILRFFNYRIVAWVTRPERPKFRQLEVRARRAPRLLVFIYWQRQNIYLSFHRLLLRLPLLPWNVSRGIKGRFYLFSGRPSLCCALNRARMRWWCADRPSRTYAHTYFHAHMRPYLRLFSKQCLPTHMFTNNVGLLLLVVGGGLDQRKACSICQFFQMH